MITRRINGGLNGYGDRQALYTRTALVMLGYEMTSGVVRRFQGDAGLVTDDIAGPATRTALHERLLSLEAASVPDTPPAEDPDQAAPEPAPAETDDPIERARALIDEAAELLRAV